MTVVTLDTHAVVKDLLAAGFTDQQAEAVTRVVSQAYDVDLSHLATKSDVTDTKLVLQKDLAATKSDLEKDLADTKLVLQKDLAEFKSDLERKILETKVDILKWTMSTIGLQTLVILGAVLTLLRLGGH